MNVLRWQSTTVYQGDRVGVLTPTGGTVVQELFDVRGQTVEKRQYRTGGLSGLFDATNYGFDLTGQLKTVTDPMGNQWSYTYDLLGCKTDRRPGRGTRACLVDL